jgi:hypothetical protein
MDYHIIKHFHHVGFFTADVFQYDSFLPSNRNMDIDGLRLTETPAPTDCLIISLKRIGNPDKCHIIAMLPIQTKAGD